jgi:hypothetical protein
MSCHVIVLVQYVPVEQNVVIQYCLVLCLTIRQKGIQCLQQRSFRRSEEIANRFHTGRVGMIPRGARLDGKSLESRTNGRTQRLGRCAVEIEILKHFQGQTRNFSMGCAHDDAYV